MKLSRYLFKAMPKEGIHCNNCHSVYATNPLVFIIPLLIGLTVNAIFLGEQPKYISIVIQIVIVSVLTLVLAIKKPFVLVKNEPTQKKHKPIKWYTSPILYVGVFFVVILFFAFK